MLYDKNLIKQTFFQLHDENVKVEIIHLIYEVSLVLYEVLRKIKKESSDQMVRVTEYHLEGMEIFELSNQFL